MDVQLICNQQVVTYNKFWIMNPIGLSAPCSDYLDIIALHPVKKIKGQTQWDLVPLGTTRLR